MMAEIEESKEFEVYAKISMTNTIKAKNLKEARENAEFLFDMDTADEQVFEIIDVEEVQDRIKKLEEEG